MTNQEKKVPELRFPEFDEEWEEKTIGKIATTFSGGTPSSTNRSYYNGEIPFIRSGEISKSSTELMINKEAISNSSAKMVEKGDLLYALYGATSGEVAISKINGAINQAVLCIRSQESATYIFNYLKMKKDQILKTYIQGGQGNLSASIIKKVDINLPYIEEQEKIGTFFSKLDRQIELEEQKLAKLEEQKKGYMQKLFSQELRFKDENGDDYPEWMETNIRNTFDNKGGTALEKEFDNNGTHKVISIGSYSMNSTYNEQNLRINKNEFTEKYLLNEGDLAMVLNDKTKEGNIIGRSIYIDEDDKYIYNQRTERLIPVTGNNHKFLWYLMNSEQFRKKIKQMMQGATQVYINYNSIKDLSIYLPILEEQNKISNFFTKFDERIENQNQKIDGLKKRKKGFLQKMFV